MSNRYSLIALGLTLALAVGSPVSAQDAMEDDRPGIAVMPLDNGGSHGSDAEAENFDALDVGLQQILLTELSQNRALRIVERGRLAEILQEFELSDQGLVDASTAAQVGNLVGARYMVLGSFTDLFGEMVLTVRVVDVETSEVLPSAKVQGEREETLSMLIDLAETITAQIDLPSLPAQVREAREEQAEPVTPEGLRKYSRALKLIDAGFEEQGMETLVEVQSEFPDWEEPRMAMSRQETSAGS